VTDTSSVGDELVELVARATAIFFKADKQPDMSGNPFAKMLPHQKRDCFDAARAAIEAIAPRLRAEGMREAVEIMMISEGDIDFAKFRILARADALLNAEKPQTEV